MIDLSIILLNYKTKEITADCLRTIEASTDTYQKEVIVVDNESDDGSVQYLAKKFPKYTVLASGKNGGFSYGNNVGIKKATGAYIWILNNDTLLQKDTIQKLMDQAIANDSDIASCQLLNTDGTTQPQGGYLPSLGNLAAWMWFIDDIPLIKSLIKPYQQQTISFYHRDQHPGWLGGTALLVKAQAYKDIGGLDDTIFMYGEDVDFCIRAANKGYSLDYFHTPKLTHLGQASGSSKGAVLGEYKGLKFIYQKHKPSWQKTLLRLLLKSGALARVLLFGILYGDKTRKNIYQEAFNLA